MVVPPYTRKETLECNLTQWVSSNVKTGKDSSGPASITSIDLNAHPSGEQYDTHIEEIEKSVNKKNIFMLYHLESVIGLTGIY